MESGQGERSMDGLTARETFQAIVSRVRRMVTDQYDCWHDDLKPVLAKHSIRILEMDDLTSADLGWLEEYYLTKIRPVLTPLAIDPAHPFPQLLNKSLNLMVRLEMAPRDGNGQPPQHP